LDEEIKKLKELYQEQNIKSISESLKNKQKYFILYLKKKKLSASYLKCKLLLRKTKRRDQKIQNLCSLLQVLKQKNLINQTTFEVFMVVNRKGKWKWPIAYFLKNRMSRITLAKLIKIALIITSNIKLRIRCITRDAESINVSAFKILGCNLRM